MIKINKPLFVWRLFSSYCEIHYEGNIKNFKTRLILRGYTEQMEDKLNVMTEKENENAQEISTLCHNVNVIYFYFILFCSIFMQGHPI